MSIIGKYAFKLLGFDKTTTDDIKDYAHRIIDAAVKNGCQSGSSDCATIKNNSIRSYVDHDEITGEEIRVFKFENQNGHHFEFNCYGRNDRRVQCYIPQIKLFGGSDVVWGCDGSRIKTVPFEDTLHPDVEIDLPKEDAADLLEEIEEDIPQVDAEEDGEVCLETADLPEVLTEDGIEDVGAEVAPEVEETHPEISEDIIGDLPKEATIAEDAGVEVDGAEETIGDTITPPDTQVVEDTSVPPTDTAQQEVADTGIDTTEETAMPDTMPEAAQETVLDTQEPADQITLPDLPPMGDGVCGDEEVCDDVIDGEITDAEEITDAASDEGADIKTAEDATVAHEVDTDGDGEPDYTDVAQDTKEVIDVAGYKDMIPSDLPDIAVPPQPIEGLEFHIDKSGDTCWAAKCSEVSAYITMSSDLDNFYLFDELNDYTELGAEMFLDPIFMYLPTVAYPQAIFHKEVDENENPMPIPQNFETIDSDPYKQYTTVEPYDIVAGDYGMWSVVLYREFPSAPSLNSHEVIGDFQAVLDWTCDLSGCYQDYVLYSNSIANIDGTPASCLWKWPAPDAAPTRQDCAE